MIEKRAPTQAGGTLRRRDFLLASAVITGFPVILRSSERPNIIFLLSDDQRWDSLGCMGNPIVRTPHVDRLAEQGTLFRNNFVTTSICMTSRASILTGLYASVHRINDFSTSFTVEQYARTYPERLRNAGYHVGFIGKYGVGDRMPADRFDYWAGFPGQGRYFPEGEGGAHLTDIMGDQAIEFLDRAPAGRPFCLSVSFKAPHVEDPDPRQFLYSRATENLYADTEIPVPETADPRYISLRPVEVQRSEGRRRWGVRFSTPLLFQQSVRAYYRLITEIDTVVGKIRQQLEKSGADRNTVIVYSSDNGFYLGEHGLAGKWLMHEESIRTPMIVWDPRRPNSERGRSISEMTLNIDIAPTLLSLAGIDPDPSVQGRDLGPLMAGQQAGWRNDWFYEHRFTNNGWIPQTEGVRTQRCKYTLYTDTEPAWEELFDLDRDPKEKENLAASPVHQAQIESMRSRHKSWRDALAGWHESGTWHDPTEGRERSY
jgi:arylsulfatase A-like enzyme